LLGPFLKILSANDEEIDLFCIRRLESRGYLIESAGPWETRSQICHRLCISESKFDRRIERFPRPKVSEIEIGPAGRLIRLRSNPPLDRFLKGLPSLTKDLCFRREISNEDYRTVIGGNGGNGHFIK
jgi:hypothetical protein